jgi:cytochrome oxidase Cu insertion factor (SCO1/SenC/PrrC family)
MKKVFYFLAATLFPCLLLAQTTVQNEQIPDAPYKKNPNMPAFNLLKTDSTWYTNADLPARKPVIFIYFSPECGHCQIEMKNIALKMDSVKLNRAQFVLISFHPVPDLEKFGRTYDLFKFKNLVIGRDTKYFLPSFFKVEFTPYIAVYDKKGKFNTEFRDGAKPEQLSEVLDKL